MSTITFYDIPSTAPGKAFSPSAWKVRYALNYKKLVYKTEWIDYVNIESRCKELGIAHTTLKTDGSPQFTLPAIYDPKTGVYLSDSPAIIEYLERTYPEPTLFPHDTVGLQLPFESAVRAVVPKSLWSFIIPASFLNILPESKDYFRRTREAKFSKTIEEMIPQGDKAVAIWNELKDSLGTIDSWYKRSGGPFIMGATVSLADFIVGSQIIYLRTIFHEDSKQWRDIASWHDGRWSALMDQLKPYQATV